MKSECIPDPLKFNGNSDILRTFVALLKLKILGNSDRFPSVAHQLMYATGRLESMALEQIMPYISPTGVNLASLEALITILESTFGDPDRVAMAEREHERLQQPNRDFSAYYTNF